MSDKIGARMGRWFVRILGAPTVQKMKDSADAIRSEYEAGRDQSSELAPREVPHREVKSSLIDEAERDDAAS